MGRQGKSDRISFLGDFSGDFWGDAKKYSLVGELMSFVVDESSRGLTRSRHA
jgi:hypothetical protein